MRPSVVLFRDGTLAEPFAAGFKPNQVDSFVVFTKVPALGLAAYYAQAQKREGCWSAALIRIRRQRETLLH